MRILVAFVVSAVGSTAMAGPCPIYPLGPSVSTVASAEIPPGGGVRVSLSELREAGTSGELEQKSWRFVEGGKSIAPVIRILAPGLAVYEPPAGTTPIKLVDGKRDLVVVRRVASAPTLAAPAVTSIVHTDSPGTGPRSSSSDVQVLLTGDRPDGAVAIILYVTDGKTDTAATWSTAFGYTGPRGAIEVYRSPDRCRTQIPGLRETPAGTRVKVAWVDVGGRIGAKSRDFVVARGKTPFDKP